MLHWIRVHRFSSSLDHWFSGSLGSKGSSGSDSSLDHWFSGSLDHWFIGSLVQQFTGSLVQQFTRSLVHWFSSSLDHWFSTSLDHWYKWFTGSLFSRFSSSQRIKGSCSPLDQWFISSLGSLVQRISSSLDHWFSSSLDCTGSQVAVFTGSLVHIVSAVHWMHMRTAIALIQSAFTGSLVHAVHWFSGSLDQLVLHIVHQVNGSFVQWITYVMNGHWFSSVTGAKVQLVNCAYTRMIAITGSEAHCITAFSSSLDHRFIASSQCSCMYLGYRVISLPIA